MFDFADNMVKLRKRDGITQEQIADFLGVTKASVSKWETKQSMPDISILPRLASYFNISIDDLLGYHPKLSTEEIEEIYGDLAWKFANEPFEKVMKESEELVKQHYSCYPFLLRIAELWMNHYMLTENPERKNEILEMVAKLCVLVVEKEKDPAICNEATMCNAQSLLILGRYEEVVDVLEKISDPLNGISESKNILIQAYQALGKVEMAEKYTQLLIFDDISNMVSHSTTYLASNMQNIEKCLKTIERVKQVMASYNFRNINPNMAALFYLQSAMVYAVHERKEDFYEMLEYYVECIWILFRKGIVLIQNDDYFDTLEQYLKQRNMMKQVPRDKKVVFESAMSIFDHPVFEKYQKETKFAALRQKLLRKGEEICR